MSVPTEIDRLVAADTEALVALRHDLHRHPELSSEERRTTGEVEAALVDLGLQTRRGPAGVGLIADLGPPGGPRMAVRADLDALALDEETAVPYASVVPGRMHACGHDVHTTCVVGAARALARAAPNRRLRFLFQSAEETAPGGSLELIEAGAMDGVAFIIGLHCDPGRRVGRVGLRAGTLTAAADGFLVEIKGAGGHGARPHETQDTVLAATHAIQALYHALDRGIDARDPCVISVGTVHAGRTSSNVIPTSVTFTGTVRTIDRATRSLADAVFRRVLNGIGAIWGVTYSYELQRGAPPVVNDPRAVDALAEAARVVLGTDAVETIGPPSMGGEDFAFYLDHAPGALLRLGTGISSPLHSSTFEADDAAIAAGARILARAAFALGTPA